MVKPVLYINGEALDMGTLPSITVERHNPLLSEGQQSYSYPFTLPRTARNERLLGFPARYQRTHAAHRSFPCTLACGHVQRIGTLLINSIAHASYDSSMTFDTAQVLGDIGGKKLEELTWEVIRWDNGTKDDVANAVKDNFAGKSNILSGKTETFPLAVEWDTLPDGQFAGAGLRTTLNNFQIVGIYEETKPLSITSYVRDGKLLQLSYPFGLAPFLRVDYVLKVIFEHNLRYYLDLGNRAYNPLEHICMLHGVADVIADNALRLKQLVADCTVEDFITSIENMFCSKFVFNSKTNVVRWVLWNDCLRGECAPNGEGWIPRPDVLDGGTPMPYGKELHPYLEGLPDITMLPCRAIKLTMQRNLDSDGKPPCCKVITPEEFYSETVKNEYPQSTSLNVIEDHRWGKVEAVRLGMLTNDYFFNVCSNTFNYYNGVDGNASEDKPIAAEHIPVFTSLSGSFIYTVPFYGFGLSFVNSVPSLDPTTPANDKKSERPLAFSSDISWGGVHISSPIGNISENSQTQSLRLHLPEGLFSSYHALRDAVIRNGVYRLTVKLDRTIAISENELYLFDGQPVMVESVQEALGSDAPQTVVLQTIKIFE